MPNKVIPMPRYIDLGLAKVVLNELEDGLPHRRIDLLQNTTMMYQATPYTFQNILDYLISHPSQENAYILRVGRGLYQITNKGIKFLEGLNSET